MKLLFDPKTIDSLRSTDKLPFECEQCCKIFYIEMKWIKSNLKLKQKPYKHRFCSRKCWIESTLTQIDISCAQCSKSFKIRPSQKNRSKSGKNFCSQSCAAVYNNTHKSVGNRRSKLETWIEDQLITTYTKLDFLFNDKTNINSELDIYIPSLKLAFELNGIFHYEPIYGQEKLASIQNNDNRKFQACLERGIELVIIDSSLMKHFKLERAKKFLTIIEQIINTKLM